MTRALGLLLALGLLASLVRLARLRDRQITEAMEGFGWA